MQKASFSGAAIPILIVLLTGYNLAAQTPAATKGVTVTTTAAADTAKGNTYAIITGVSKYQHIPSLQYADADAILFRKFLNSPAGGNTKPDNILSFINENATAAAFNLEARRWLKNKNLKKGDQLYLYFSGHGDATEEGSYFFLAHDCYPNNDEHNYTMGGAIDLSQVKKLIKFYTEKGITVFFILDACRTNELSGGEKGQKNFTTFIAEEKMGEIILLSTSPNQVSIESPTIGSGHGLYTYYLVDGLIGAADKNVIGDDDGKVSLSELSAYLTQRVTKQAKDVFKTTQVPYWCCSDKNQDIISTIDVQMYSSWEGKKKLTQLGSDTNALAYNAPKTAKGIGDISDADSLQVGVYNRFAEAIKNEKISGDGSAASIYAELEKKWPKHPLTADAKYMLAAAYIDFCQQKINLFLSGKGLIHIVNMGKEVNKDNPGDVDNDEQVNKLKTIISTGYDKAQSMMERAIALLKDDPEALQPLVPKINFIKTMAAYGDKGKDLKAVQKNCRELLVSDPASPAGYLLMGWIYQDMENDSCYDYFKKAAAIAPKWAYPQHGLGIYYFVKHQYDSAQVYFKRAIHIDKLYASAYRNLGMIYFNESGYNYDKKSGMNVGASNATKLVEAQTKFREALKLDSCDSDANEYLAKVLQTYKYYPQAENKFKLSINCHPDFISGYKSLSELYTEQNNDVYALATLKECVEKNPSSSEALRNLGNYYLNTSQNYDSAEVIFKRAIALEPAKDKNYFSLARMYKMQGKKTEALAVYNEVRKKLGNSKTLFNELGNLYFKAPSDFAGAITYYNMALQTDSTLDYVYYNLALVHKAMNAVRDSVVHYYGKAIDYNPNRWQKFLREVTDFYWYKKDTAQALHYTLLKIKFKNQPYFNDLNDESKLVTVLVAQKKFAEAERMRDLYVDPKKNRSTYKSLMETFNKTDGFFDYKLGTLHLTRAAFMKFTGYIALSNFMQLTVNNGY